MTASERKVRALRYRSVVMVFSRNLSFVIRTRALIDGHWRAVQAMLFAVFLWRRRIRLASSAWNDSSLASKLLSRIHDSAPYIRHGGTQCSIMFIEERGFSLPWKTPLPLAKKALLASLCCCLSRTGMKGWVTTMLQDISRSWLACVSCWLE